MAMLSENMVEDFFRPFKPAQVTEILTLARLMERFSVTPEEVLEMGNQYFLKLKEDMEKNNPLPIDPVPQKQKKIRGKSNRPFTTCPVCGNKVIIELVNVSKCTNVGGDWHTSLICTNTDCRFTELSTKTMEEWRVENGI